ncbi:DUF6338 family protein [Rosistilla oblonga]|uniref:DUF6338 family protein n=1 Tax=Rosistilla oblonga TaxID=2527990 RepID=UPI003A977806
MSTLNSVGKLSDLGIVFALLPGLVTYLVVRLCTGRERKIDVTETILHGLAYTLLSHAVWVVCTLPGSLLPTPEIVSLTLSAIVVGLVVSLAINRRVAFRTLRKLGLTREPEFPTVWETTFKLSEHDVGEYVVLELDDERRILGAILGVSPEQRDGHIALQRSQWLPMTPNDATIQIEGWFLIPAARVCSIHFLPRYKANDARETETTPTAADT